MTAEPTPPSSLLYPEWLGRCLLENQLPWHLGRSLSWSEFRQKYTLENALWVGAFADWAYGRSMTLVFNWEPYRQNPDLYPESIHSPWLFLMIQVNGIASVRTYGYEPVLSGVHLQRSIAQVTQVEQTLILQDEFDAIVKITFTEDLVFLVLDENRTAIVL